MKLMIFGGTFDPPHNGHIELIKSLKLSAESRLIILPNHLPPHKQKTSADAAHRLKMCQIAFENYEVSDYELTKLDLSYTYKTLEDMSSKYALSRDDLIYLIGADSMHDLKTWSYPKELARLATFLVFHRPNYNDVKKDIEEFESLYDSKIILSDIVGMDLSSTEIRVRNAFSQIDGFVPDKIAQYIKDNKLYNDYKYITEYYKEMDLDEKRIHHIMNVTLTAQKLAKIHNADVEKIIVAAMLHDISKNITLKKAYKMGMDISCGTIALPAKCRHAVFGTELAKKYFHIYDTDILDAIKYHTTGRPKMSLYEKIIFLADYIEPDRKMPGLSIIRKAALTDLDLAVKLTLKSTLDYLENYKRDTAQITKDAYEFYNKEKN